jgi:phage tail-like protein
MNGTSWLLGGGYSWHSADPAVERLGERGGPIVSSPQGGLSLVTLPGGPRGLRSSDGSLGRLTLPLGVAVDGETVLILSEDGTRVYRYDPVRATLVVLPNVGMEGLGPNPPGDAHREARRFRAARNIAAHRGELYVADPETKRVQVFDLATLALLRIHALEEPWDVAAGERGVYILDRKRGRVLLGSHDRDRLRVVIEGTDLGRRWERIAVDREDRVYLLDGAAPAGALDVFVVPSRDPAHSPAERFIDSAEVRDRFGTGEVSMDGHGDIVLPPALLDPCGLRRPAGPATHRWTVGDRTYLIDAATRVVRVYLADGRLRHRFGPYDAQGVEVSSDDPASWSPADLLATGGCVYLLDERHRVVYTHRPGDETIRESFRASADAVSRWRRLADNGSGCLLLWDGVADSVERVDQRGRALSRVPLREVRARFDRKAPPAPSRAGNVATRLTRRGPQPRPTKKPSVWPVPAFRREGTWMSEWLDSELYNCQWHVIELKVKVLPPGSRITLRTRTTNDSQSGAELLAALSGVGALGSWRGAPAVEAEAQPAPLTESRRDVDILVPSGPGRYLQVEVRLEGNGIASPVIESLRLRFPRESLLQYLPAIYSAPEEQREFLDRYLAVMQTTWTAIERDVDTFERFLDPDSVPSSALAYLAGWLDLQLEGTWSAEQNRRLLQTVPALRATWGTVEGLRGWLRVYLANLAGVSSEQLAQADIPGIVESFVERRRVMLNRPDTATLGASEGLWSPAVERRFQLGVYDREGEVELVSAGDPATDLFRHYAHAFRVYVPAQWVRTPAHEALIRRAIELQKPAHATYELVLVEPRFRIGDQSTVALDTVIGDPLAQPLLCATVEDAPSRPPYQRLGFDTTLGGSSAPEYGSALERSLV